MIVIWLGLFLWLIKAAIGSLQETVRRSPVPAGDIVLFASSAAVIGALGSFIFIGLARLPTQPWQFLPVITFLAACFDAALASRLDRFRVARLVAVFLIVGLQFPRAADQTRYRQTNIDLIASKLNHDVAPGDCIVVHPWYCGVTFG